MVVEDDPAQVYYCEVSPVGNGGAALADRWVMGIPTSALQGADKWFDGLGVLLEVLGGHATRALRADKAGAFSLFSEEIRLAAGASSSTMQRRVDLNALAVNSGAVGNHIAVFWCQCVQAATSIIWWSEDHFANTRELDLCVNLAFGNEGELRQAALALLPRMLGLTANKVLASVIVDDDNRGSVVAQSGLLEQLFQAKGFAGRSVWSQLLWPL